MMTVICSVEEWLKHGPLLIENGVEKINFVNSYREIQKTKEISSIFDGGKYPL